MIEEHPDFETPRENCKIWRYLSFAKTVAMNQQQALYFSRADKLGDPFEGSITRLMAAERDAYFEDNPDLKEPLQRKIEHMRKSVYVNCWHMSEHESEAMWKLYAKGEGEGIAIQSTIGRLRACLRKSPLTPIYIGKVHYLDFVRGLHPNITGLDTIKRYILKRESLRHEAELRAVLVSPVRDEGERKIPIQDEYGIDVRVRLETLIERIYVAPTAADWFFDAVRSLFGGHREDQKLVVRSELDSEAIF